LDEEDEDLHHLDEEDEDLHHLDEEDEDLHHLDEEDEDLHHLDEDDVDHFPRQLPCPALLAVLMACISRGRLLYSFSAEKA